VGVRRARLYDLIAFIAAAVVISVDQWAKSLIVANFSPEGSKPAIPLVGPYLSITYLMNRGAAFSSFQDNGLILTVLIAIAIVVVAILYLRMVNSGPLAYKFTFGLIIGGAIGNLIDRAHYGGSVVDFIAFRVPGFFNFAVFNFADASISVGVVLLFLFVFFSGRKSKGAEAQAEVSSTASGALRTGEQDAQH
jgi:signal peptidase II